MKVVVCNALSTNSHGDQELFRRLLILLAQRRFSVEAITPDSRVARQRFPAVECLDRPGVAPGAPALVRGVVARWRLAVTLLSPWLPGIYRLLPAAQRHAVASLRNADLIVAAPGSYLANPAQPLAPELGQLWVAAMARAPLVMAPMSISEPEAGLKRWLLRRVLQRARYVFVREAKSEMVCRDLGTSAFLSNDIGFLDDGFSRAPQGDSAPAHIAVTVLTREVAGRERDAAQRRYLEAMVASIGILARTSALPVKLIVQDKRDSNTARQLANSLTVPVEIVDAVASPEKLHALLPGSYCLLASRMGAAMQALAAGCPVAVLTSRPGHRSMLHLYGLDDLGMPVDAFDAGSLSALLLRWGDDRTGFRQRCASLRDSLRRVGDPFIDCLASVTVPHDD